MDDVLTVEHLLKVSAEKTVRIAELEAALAIAEAKLRTALSGQAILDD